ncbi:unnamed protein product [Rhodiola kirilowii]
MDFFDPRVTPYIKNTSKIKKWQKKTESKELAIKGTKIASNTENEKIGSDSSPAFRKGSQVVKALMSVETGVIDHEDRGFNRGSVVDGSVGGVVNAVLNKALRDCPVDFGNAVAVRGLGFGGLNAGVDEKDLNEMEDVICFSADSFRDGNLSSVGNVNQVSDVANLVSDVSGYSNVSGPNVASKFKLEILNKFNAARKKRDATTGKSEYAAGSLVWGKIPSHPWWPGQIFDTADSSKEALRHYKEGKLLVAYFGDGTFAWNEIMQLKPFQLHFAGMENQTDMETFCCAVDCALDEVYRRVGFGLSCTCLAEDVYADIQSQLVENSGIYKKSRRRDFQDEGSSVECFVPSKLVSYVKEAAKFSRGSVDRLELVKSIAQLASFCRWKKYRKLPEFADYGVLLLDDNAKLTSVDGRDIVAANNAHHVFPFNNGITEDHGKHLDKCKQRPNCSLTAMRKKKKISDLMDDDELYVPYNRVEAKRKPKHKAIMEAGFPKNKIGKKTRKPRKKKMISNVLPRDATINQTVGRSISSCLSPEELFTQLSLTAVDPVNNHSPSIPLVKSFSQFRNLSCLNRPISAEANKSLEEESIKKSDIRIPEYEYRMPLSEEHVEDSNCTALIVKDNAADKSSLDSHDELASDLTQLSSRVVLPILGSETDPQLHTFTDLKTQDVSGNHESVEGDLDIPGKQEPGNHKDEMMRTALLLKFSEQNPVPSVSDLNKYFSCYGPLHASETQIMKRSVAKVIFKRSCDAEAAFSSAGKYRAFGPSLISYRLKYLFAKPEKSSPQPKKRQKKAAPNE